MSNTKQILYKTIQGLLERRKVEDVEFELDDDFYDELQLDSLEVAELSATLEDELGRDPFSDGLDLRTAAEVLAYYEARDSV